MTHYYFDLKNGITKRDHSGLELDNDRQAIARAQSIADQLRVSEGDHTRRVSVVHEDGHEVMCVLVDVESS